MPKEWIYFYGLTIDAWYTPAALVHPDYSGRYRHPIATACVTSCLNIDTLACFQQDKLRTACRHARFGRIWLGLTGLFWVCRCCVTGPRFSTVITSSAGYPLDKTYYQTVKGMVCHSHRPQLPGSPHSLAPVCSAWCVRRSGPGCGACIY